jgi:dihydrofolate reductase
MKLTTMTQVTIDGVMQGNGAASDDRRNGFERGGWARRAGDDETRAFITQTFQRADAFLIGRRTYELFASSWRSIGQMRAHPIGVALNEAPKYVVSTTLTAPGWEHTTVLRGDLVAAISELKAGPGGELQVHGGRARRTDDGHNHHGSSGNARIRPFWSAGDGWKLPAIPRHSRGELGV